MILSILKPVFSPNSTCLGAHTSRFGDFCVHDDNDDDDNDDTANYFTPANARGVISRDGRAKRYTNKSSRDNNG